MGTYTYKSIQMYRNIEMIDWLWIYTLKEREKKNFYFPRNKKAAGREGGKMDVSTFMCARARVCMCECVHKVKRDMLQRLTHLTKSSSILY